MTGCKELDMEKWVRRSHYLYYKSFDSPLYSTTVSMDAGALYARVHQERKSFFLACLFAFTRAANEIPEFRIREHRGGIVEWDKLDVIAFVPSADGEFSQALLKYHPDFSLFSRGAQEIINRCAAASPILIPREQIPGNALMASCTPWYSFTHVSSAIMSAHGQVPLIRWGKIMENPSTGRYEMPLAIQCNHLFIDGIHLGRFLDHIRDSLLHTEWLDA